MQMYGMSGEPLGLIGRPEPSVETLPTWKEDILAKPSASVRKGIAWGFGSPYEDTDTLVLTARSGTFVDVRFPKDAKTSEEALNHSSYWAFSGQVKTTFYDAGSQPHAIGLPYTAHCVFEHDIDSRGDDIVDEGDMFTLQNGDCLEMGMMVNPDSGDNELYKEYWTGVDPPPNSKSTAVAVTEDNDGIVICIGDRIQCLMRDRSDPSIVRAGRFMVSNTSSMYQVDGDVRNSIEITGFPLFEWLTDSTRQVGDTTLQSDVTWKIIEKHDG